MAHSSGDSDEDSSYKPEEDEETNEGEEDTQEGEPSQPEATLVNRGNTGQPSNIFEGINIHLHESLSDEVFRDIHWLILENGGNPGADLNDEDELDVVVANPNRSIFRELRYTYSHSPTIWVEDPTWVRWCVYEEKEYKHPEQHYAAMSGPKPGYNAFNIQHVPEDDRNLILYLKRRIPYPEYGGRQGNNVYKELVARTDLYPWASRHSWQGWRERYKRQRHWMDEAIARIVEQDPPLPNSKGLYSYRRQEKTIRHWRSNSGREREASSSPPARRLRRRKPNANRSDDDSQDGQESERAEKRASRKRQKKTPPRDSSGLEDSDGPPRKKPRSSSNRRGRAKTDAEIEELASSLVRKDRARKEDQRRARYDENGRINLWPIASDSESDEESESPEPQRNKDDGGRKKRSVGDGIWPPIRVRSKEPGHVERPIASTSRNTLDQPARPRPKPKARAQPQASGSGTQANDPLFVQSESEDMLIPFAKESHPESDGMDVNMDMDHLLPPLDNSTPPPSAPLATQMTLVNPSSTPEDEATSSNDKGKQRAIEPDPTPPPSTHRRGARKSAFTARPSSILQASQKSSPPTPTDLEGEVARGSNVSRPSPRVKTPSRADARVQDGIAADSSQRGRINTLPIELETDEEKGDDTDVISDHEASARIPADEEGDEEEVDELADDEDDEDLDLGLSPDPETQPTRAHNMLEDILRKGEETASPVTLKETTPHRNSTIKPAAKLGTAPDGIPVIDLKSPLLSRSSGKVQIRTKESSSSLLTGSPIKRESSSRLTKDDALDPFTSEYVPPPNTEAATYRRKLRSHSVEPPVLPPRLLRSNRR